MKIIVGLGNPGKRYEHTRHNAGFIATDELARRLRIGITREKAGCLIGTGNIDSGSVILAKPQTFMNESGRAVAALLRESYASPGDLLVVHDELDLPLGTVRVKAGGGHGGHNGLRSLIAELGSPDFVRVRIGIGRPGPGVDPADYVLSPFLPEEREAAAGTAVKAAETVMIVISQGVTKAMNMLNQK